MTNRLFVLDTNVLMHDPSALYRFEEHDIFLAMMVLEELDDHKKGLNEVARNVRQVTRELDQLMSNLSHQEIQAGITLALSDNGDRGKLFLQTDELPLNLPVNLPGNKVDNQILAVTLALKHQDPSREITIVSKDINLRIKAGMIGIHAEDYYSDKVLEDVSLLPSGLVELPADFWENHAENVDSWHEEERTYYRFNAALVEQLSVNDCIALSCDEKPFEAIVKQVEGGQAVVQIVRDYRIERNAIWGITARNREQNFALNLLLDDDIDFVTLQGAAGSGKTLLTLAAGLMQTLDNNRFQEIIMTRITVPVGEDIGFLPGTEEEKMTPWMGALLDNLEVLHQNSEDTNWQKEATQDILMRKIKIRSLNFMRGRTLLNRFLIIDEAQNLSAKQIKTLVTRSGPGTKVVCLGDIAQIDTPYLTQTTSGLTYAVERFKHWQHSGHMTLNQSERSRLAQHAAEIL